MENLKKDNLKIGKKLEEEENKTETEIEKKKRRKQ